MSSSRRYAAVGSDDEEEPRYVVPANVNALQQQQPELVSDGVHVPIDSFDNAKTIAFDVSIVGTPEQLAKGEVSNTWSLQEELLKHLKHNTALANRLQVSEEDLKGDLAQCVPLAFEVVEHGNSFPFAIGFNVPGLMPNTFTQHGAWAHTTAAKTNVVPLNGSIAMEPVSVIDKALLVRSQRNTRSDINSDVRLEKDYGIVKVDSPAYFKMVDALANGEWHDVDMTEEEYHSIVEPGQHARVVQVPRVIAAHVKENMEGPIREFMERCINLKDFVITAERADGHTDFNDSTKFVGEQIGANLDMGDELPSTASNTVQRYHAKCIMKFSLGKSDTE